HPLRHTSLGERPAHHAAQSAGDAGNRECCPALDRRAGIAHAARAAWALRVGHRHRPSTGGASRSWQISVHEQTRRPWSSVMAIATEAVVRPAWMSVAVPVTVPDEAGRWWIALMVMPTAARPGPAYR